jgi:hypothetical protein
MFRAIALTLRAGLAGAAADFGLDDSTATDQLDQDSHERHYQ